MNITKVETNNKSYEIVIIDSFDSLHEKIKALNGNYSKIGVFADDNVAPLYLETVKANIKKSYDNVVTYTFENGEENKNLRTIEGFYDFLIQEGFDRKSLVVALGGGVTGDMVGYMAATYMRGIRFVQVPTTILSQVDSSVGGKTGVDFKGYKNVVGAFYQPELVFINTEVLKTLPPEQIASGMAEVIKHGVIKDEKYFSFLEKEVDAIHNLEYEVIAPMISRSCEIKSSVVSEDEKEQGVRAFLNFGHTIGHAIERMQGFKMFHGECVAVGMVAAMYLAEAKGYVSEEEINRVTALIEAYKLPVFVEDMNSEEIYEELFHDKKTSHGNITFVISDYLGHCYLDNSFDKITIVKAIEKIIK